MEDDEYFNKKYVCENCKYATNASTDFLKHCKSALHLRNGEKKPKKKHYCEHCDYESENLWCIKNHNLTTHSTKEEREKHKYYCSVCDVVFFSPLYLDRHLNGKKHKNCIAIQMEMEKINKKGSM
jgi:hypothetical protein